VPDSRRGAQLWQTGRFSRFYLPLDDIRSDLLIPATRMARRGSGGSGASACEIESSLTRSQRPRSPRREMSCCPGWCRCGTETWTGASRRTNRSMRIGGRMPAAPAHLLLSRRGRGRGRGGWRARDEMTRTIPPSDGSTRQHERRFGRAGRGGAAPALRASLSPARIRPSTIDQALSRNSACRSSAAN
jgi:hypothetical protein